MIDVVAGLARAVAPQQEDGISNIGATERALRTIEERYRDLFENATDAVFTTDVDLNFTSLNGVAERLIGYSRDEAQHLNVAAIVTAETLEEVQRRLKEQRDGKPASIYETEILTRDGRRVPIEITARLVFREGHPVGMQGIARDISERKRLEQGLRQAHKMEAVGRLAGGVAHDFNNLLTVIIGHSQEIVERLAPDDPSHADAAQIVSAGELAAGMTRQLLAYSRQQIVAPRVLDLNAVVGSLTPMLQRLIGAHVDLTFRTGAEAYAVQADPGQLEQVIMNLVVNARDAMPNGGRLTIETSGTVVRAADFPDRPWMVPGEYVLLTVTDTGQGMEAETKAHIFEPFFTTKAAGRGTGLGLSTVYGIVKQCGGYIFVESDNASWTTFQLYFPRRPVSEIVPAATMSAARRTSGGGERILVVDDNRGVRDFAVRVLASRGYVVLSASSPNEARELAAEARGRIDLLLTDLVMPGLTGPELADAMRTSSSSMKVIYMSGYGTEGITDRGVLDPSVMFIGKPFASEHLARRVREMLDGTKGR